MKLVCLARCELLCRGVTLAGSDRVCTSQGGRLLTFNDILNLSEIDPIGVKLVRHQDNRLPAGRL